MREIVRIAARLIDDEGGNIALITAAVFPIVLAAAAFSVDLSSAMNQRSSLQAIADSAALAGAKEMLVINADLGTVEAAAKAHAEAQLASGRLGAGGEREVAVATDMNAHSVQVTIREDAAAFFRGVPLLPDPGEVSVVAEARAYGQARLCLVGLNPKRGDTVLADNTSSLTAPDCVAHSNSADKDGLRAQNGSKLTAQLICTVGGYKGDPSSFSPEPLTDCPKVEDPLADRPPPPYSGCDFNGFRTRKKETLSPGVYCGGLIIDQGADVTLSPGIYVISGGRFEVTHDASVKGEYVGFYFADSDATLFFNHRASVDLGAPKDGPMAGLLFFESRAAPRGRAFKVTSEKASNLLGTIYLPNGIFEVDASGAVAEASAYTVIIANEVHLKKEANLVLNANYDTTDVPVPAGLGPTSGTIYLNR